MNVILCCKGRVEVVWDDVLAPYRLVVLQFFEPCLLVVVERDADHLDAWIVLEVLYEFLNVWNLGATWVTPCVKRLYIPLSTRFAADLKNFLLVEVI